MVVIDMATVLCYKLLQDLLQTMNDAGRTTNKKLHIIDILQKLGGGGSNPLVASIRYSGSL